MTDPMLITSALPYANGQIHIGHLLEYIQADIYTRYLRLIGKDALYICASDMHGTPVEVNAKKAGKDPEKFALEFWKEHQDDFASFLIEFTNYYKTHSPENQKLAEYFYTQLKKQGQIYRKPIKVIYCQHCMRSLPDRYVRGTCPLCATLDQYGDVCESCSSVLKGVDLINPKCSLCGRTPIQKESEHYFFRLSAFSERLKNWMNNSSSKLQPEVRHWLQGWLEKGLEDWCISRDAPYFGFEIPNSNEETGETKYFYVWLDAPIGYISSTQNYCTNRMKSAGGKPGNWQDYWLNGKVQHFIGKDISYFHFLFWPAMLMAMNIPLPQLTVHGFITVDGQKMSKSRGTFFTAKDFLKLYPAESLRFFYASRLDRTVNDVDINFEEFKAMTNSVLMGNLGNFCYRVLTFAEKNYRKLTTVAKETKLEQQILLIVDEIKQDYETQDFKSAVRNILKIADLGNSYFQQAEPWKHQDKNEPQVTWCVNLARNLAILVSPILPAFTNKVLQAMGSTTVLWDINSSWKGTVKLVPLLVEKIEKVPASAQFPLRLAVGKIIEAKPHPDADKLYLLTVDLGSLGKKQVVAGLRSHFSADDLKNRKAVFCINMKPAKIRGQMSEAMVLVADDGEACSLLEAYKTTVGEPACFEGMEGSPQEVTFEEFKRLVIFVHKDEVQFDGKKLVTGTQKIVVHSVKEGARIY